MSIQNSNGVQNNERKTLSINQNFLQNLLHNKHQNSNEQDLVFPAMVGLQNTAYFTNQILPLMNSYVNMKLSANLGINSGQGHNSKHTVIKPIEQFLPFDPTVVNIFDDCDFCPSSIQESKCICIPFNRFTSSTIDKKHNSEIFEHYDNKIKIDWINKIKGTMATQQSQQMSKVVYYSLQFNLLKQKFKQIRQLDQYENSQADHKIFVYKMDKVVVRIQNGQTLQHIQQISYMPVGILIKQPLILNRITIQSIYIHQYTISKPNEWMITIISSVQNNNNSISSQQHYKIYPHAQLKPNELSQGIHWTIQCQTVDKLLAQAWMFDWQMGVLFGQYSTQLYAYRLEYEQLDYTQDTMYQQLCMNYISIQHDRHSTYRYVHTATIYKQSKYMHNSWSWQEVQQNGQIGQYLQIGEQGQVVASLLSTLMHMHRIGICIGQTQYKIFKIREDDQAGACSYIGMYTNFNNCTQADVSCNRHQMQAFDIVSIMVSILDNGYSGRYAEDMQQIVIMGQQQSIINKFAQIVQNIKSSKAINDIYISKNQ